VGSIGDRTFLGRLEGERQRTALTHKAELIHKAVLIHKDRCLLGAPALSGFDL
jgi:hypothetical protein